MRGLAGIFEKAQELTLDSSGRNAKDPNFDANNITQYGVMFAPNWNVYMPFIYSNGGAYLNEDMTEFGLNDPKAAEVIQNFADLINVYHVAPTAIQSNSMPAAATALASDRRPCTLTEAGTIWIWRRQASTGV